MKCAKCSRKLPDKFNSSSLGHNIPANTCPICIDEWFVSWRGIGLHTPGGLQVLEEYKEWLDKNDGGYK